MKIVFLVAHLRSGGAERTVSYLSKYMANNGCDTTIFSVDNSVFYELDPAVKFVTLNITSDFKNIFDRLHKSYKRIQGIQKEIRKINPDVVVCLMSRMAKFVLPLKKKMKFKLITSERNYPGRLIDNKTIELTKKIFKESDGIVFQTERAKEWYPKEFGDKSAVIHNAVGNELVYAVGDIKERKSKIIAMGRLAYQKDYPTLLKAFAIVQKKHPEFTLDIYGNGIGKNALEEIAGNLGVLDSVNFIPACPDALLKMADSACYVMSSKYEGMPNALMEAMAIGLPCVSTDCPNGPAELITNGENGILVPVGDYEAMAEAIIKMIEDKAFAERCSENAKKILDDHSVDKIAKKYLEFVKSVAEKIS